MSYKCPVVIVMYLQTCLQFRPTANEESVIRMILGEEEKLIEDEDFIIEEDEEEAG